MALKILRPHVEIDPQADKRFEREARHTSNLAHPNIATIYEYGEDRGRSYIAMEFLQGRTLDKIVRDQQLGFEEGLRIAVQLTSALALVHRAGLIHRDLKPANVMVLDDGTVKLLDFGIARANGEPTITQHGMLVGTVLYMSPEQVRGDELDPRSDIFSLGAMLYHALTGQLPFPGTSFPEVCMAILEGRPRPLAEVRAAAARARGLRHALPAPRSGRSATRTPARPTARCGPWRTGSPPASGRARRGAPLGPLALAPIDVGADAAKRGLAAGAAQGHLGRAAALGADDHAARERHGLAQT